MNLALVKLLSAALVRISESAFYTYMFPISN